MKYLSTLLILIATIGLQAQNNTQLLVGTYTNGKSEGIYSYNFDTLTADFTILDSTKISNPSYLTVSPNNKFIFSVSEEGNSTNTGGLVSAFSYKKKKGGLKFINQKPSGGNHPCYITIDNSGKWLITANYTGGSFSLMEVNKRGKIVAEKQVIQQYGNGVNKARQEKPHVHAAILTGNNKYILVADLGTDKVSTYSFDAVNGIISKEPVSIMKVMAGSGPRHLSIHPSQQYVYLTQELNGTIGVFSIDENGTLKLLQNISVVKTNYKGSFGGADIHVSKDGRFLYASHRGESNEIAIFSINSLTGLLTSIGHQSTMGLRPRNFNFDPTGKYLLVANQDSDNIIIFSRDFKTGLLKDTGKRIQVPSPVCIQWINK